MREAVLRDLAARAAADPAFLSSIRKDPERTLAAHGYDLTPGELEAVLDLRQRTALLPNRTLAALLVGGLAKRTGSPPVRPATPGGRADGLARPGAPGGTRRGRSSGDRRE